MFIHSKGSPDADIWVLIDKPLSNDKERGFLYSSGLGYVFDKMLTEVGITDYYITCYRPDTDNVMAYRNVTGELNQYQPKIIIPLDAIGQKLVPELTPKRRDKNYDPEIDSEIFKYAGSILISDDLKYPHYIIPTLPPDLIVRQYKLRDQVMCDLAKAKSELDYYKKHGILEPLPIITPKIHFECFDELIYIIESYNNYQLVSNDIETLYPKVGSKWYKTHPGYPIVVGLAPTKEIGISFELFRENDIETARLWRTLDKLFRNTPQLGQNWFNFDLNFYESLGFEFRTTDCQDTMIRHHVLYPELKHDMAYMSRQYTRHPYHKGTGSSWTSDKLDELKIYNVKDCCITMDIFEVQEKELEERPWLR
jgi:hypothetical protein